MTSNLKTLQWLFKQIRPVLFLLLLIILLSSITAIISVLTALVCKSLVDAATHQSLEIYKYLGFLGGILLLQILLKITYSILSTYCSNRFANTLQQKLYDHILHSQWQVQNNYHSANLITRLTSDLKTLNTFITHTVPILVSLTCTLITAFFTLLYLEPQMAFIAILIAPISVLLASLLGRQVRKYYIAYQEENIRHRSFLQESLQNIIVTKSFCEEEENLNTLKAIHQNKFKLSLKQTYLSTLSTSLLMIGAFSGYFIVFAWGANHLIHGAGAFGTLTALIQLFSNIQSPLNGLAHYFPQFITAHASSQRLMLLEELPLEDATPLPPLAHPTLSFENMTFGYHLHSPILYDINCHLHHGEIIGLVGPSGMGKTTLMRLILGLMSPSKGGIYIVEDTKRYPLSVDMRHYISYVPQGNTLFSGTIASNLLHGNAQATPDEIQEALHLACIDDFIATLDLGLNTPIGEKGLGLSEGQAQRLAIARALLRKKAILLLDEATSALDASTEAQLLSHIAHLPYHPMCLIITHRPSALSICDKIFSLKHGHFYEQSLSDSLSLFKS